MKGISQLLGTAACLVTAASVSFAEQVPQTQPLAAGYQQVASNSKGTTLSAKPKTGCQCQGNSSSKKCTCGSNCQCAKGNKSMKGKSGGKVGSKGKCGSGKCAAGKCGG